MWLGALLYIDNPSFQPSLPPPPLYISLSLACVCVCTIKLGCGSIGERRRHIFFFPLSTLAYAIAIHSFPPAHLLGRLSTDRPMEDAPPDPTAAQALHVASLIKICQSARPPSFLLVPFLFSLSFSFSPSISVVRRSLFFFFRVRETDW